MKFIGYSSKIVLTDVSEFLGSHLLKHEAFQQAVLCSFFIDFIFKVLD